ncbi:TPA: hypothetical protein DCF80_01080 [Candidatus Saccharibacteria bacterium]|nr:hypothetical protein [Candidatus Saccharibacteria bacterium]HRK40994.1 hypothetical protein [Candidatus Saccharibacteria bacterium]
MIVYLDLDRTIFKTNDSEKILLKIAELYPELDALQLEKDRTAFHETVGDLYYWDLGRQLSTYGLDAEEVFIELAGTDLADGRLEYEGAATLISSLQSADVDVRVLTFGPDDYQRFKASLCPSLRGLVVTTTLLPKSELFEASEEECWLVDDKPIGDELPGNVSFVQVSLEGQEYPGQDWPVFYSLHDVREFFADVVG